MKLDAETIEAFERDGAVLIPGLFADWVDTIGAGIERNMNYPGPYADDNVREGQQGQFFDDYCNWERIPEFTEVVYKSDVADVAGQLMQSQRVQLFHDHVLVKEPGTTAATPWHQDSPYYFVDGMQNVSFWCVVDPVTDATLRCVAGSHKWPKEVLPVKWINDADFYPDSDEYMTLPDPDAEGMRILEWPMQPGDAVAFHYRVLHGARKNDSPNRRRAFSLRFVGDDARFITRPGRTSPPFPGHDMRDGDRLREDWFPVLAPAD